MSCTKTTPKTNSWLLFSQVLIICNITNLLVKRVNSSKVLICGMGQGDGSPGETGWKAGQRRMGSGIPMVPRTMRKLVLYVPGSKVH